MVGNDMSFSWLNAPEDVKNLLRLAVQYWENTEQSTQYINEALSKSDEPIDVLLAAYRYFFYKNNSRMALNIAEKIIDKIKKSEELPSNWEEMKPILIARKEDPQIRLFLNAYAASGFILARMGELEKANIISEQVKELDFNREFGATTLFEILNRPPEEDD